MKQKKSKKIKETIKKIIFTALAIIFLVLAVQVLIHESTKENLTGAIISVNSIEKNIKENNLIILDASLEVGATPILNSSSLSNTTAENLTLYYYEGSGNKSIIDWRKAGQSITALNMPFEGGSTNTFTKDYSTFSNNMSSDFGTPVYNPTGGYDGKGAFEFDGENDGIIVAEDVDSMNFTTSGFTVMAWVKPASLVNNSADLVSHYYYLDQRSWLLQINEGVGRFIACSNGTSISYCQYATHTSEVNVSGEWHHLAGVWNTTDILVYVDGVEGTDINGLTELHYAFGRDIEIGYNRASEDFNGTLDEVLIFNEPLSAEQIKAIYENQTDLIVSQETNEGDNWSACVTPNDGTADGLEECSKALTIIATPTIINNPPTQLPPILNSTFGTNLTTEDLYAYNQSSNDLDNDNITNIYDWYLNNKSIIIFNMPFDTNFSGVEENKIEDYSDFKNNGTLGNGHTLQVPVWTNQGRLGGAYNFDGNNDLIVINNNSNLEAQELTIETWIKLPEEPYLSTNGSMAIVDKEYFTNSQGYVLRFDEPNATSDTIRFRVGDGTSTHSLYFENNNSLIFKDIWHHLVATYNHEKMQIFIDGNLVASRTTKFHLEHSERDLVIGAASYKTDDFFNGTLDEIKIYDRVLTPEQINTNYNGGIARYNIINHSETREGENWQVEIIPNDGTENGNNLTSNLIKIENNLPHSEVGLYPDPLNLIQNVYGYSNYTDLDQNKEQPGRYKFYLNQNVIAEGNSSQLFLLSFDDDAGNFTTNTSDHEEPINATGIVDYTGKFGREAYIAVGDALRYNKTGNINEEAGTILFWLQPDWNAETVEYERPFFEDENAQLKFYFDNESDTLNVTIKINSSSDYTVSTNNLSGIFVDNFWTHVALMWDCRQDLLQIYIDGEIYANNTENLNWDCNYPILGDLNIGTSAGSTQSARSHFDEYAIYNKPIANAHLQDIFLATRPQLNNEIYLSKDYITTSGDNITFGYQPFDGQEYGQETNITLTVPPNTIQNTYTNISKSVIGADGVVRFEANWSSEYTLDTTWLEIDEGGIFSNTTEKTVGYYVDDMSYFDWVNDFRTKKEDTVNVEPTTEGYILHGTDVYYNYSNDVATDYVYVRKYTDEPLNLTNYDNIIYYMKPDVAKRHQTKISVYNTSSDGSMTSCDYPAYPDLNYDTWQKVTLDIDRFYEDPNCNMENITLIKVTLNDINNSNAEEGHVLFDEIHLTKDEGFNTTQTVFNYKPLSPLTAGENVKLRMHVRDITGNVISTDWQNLTVDDDKPHIENLEYQNNYSNEYSSIKINGTFVDTTTPSKFWFQVNSSENGIYNTTAKQIGWYLDTMDDPNWLYASGKVKGPNITLTRTDGGYFEKGLNVSYIYPNATGTDYFFIELGIDPLTPNDYQSLKYEVKADKAKFHQMRMDMWCEDERPPESYRITPKQHLIRTNDWEVVDFKTEEYFTDTAFCSAQSENITRLKLEFGDYVDTDTGNGSVIIDEIYFEKRDLPTRNVEDVNFIYEWTNPNETGNFSFQICFNDTSGNVNTSEWIAVTQNQFYNITPPSIIQENGSLTALSDYWRLNVIQSGYISPSYEEKELLTNLVTEFISAMDEDNLTKINEFVTQIDPFNYELVNYTDNETNYNYYILREKNNTITRGWGAFIFNPHTTSNLILETPHPQWDYRTSVVGTQMFQQIWPKAQVISTTYRYGNRKHDNDAGHSIDNPFHSIHSALINSINDSIVVQIHGFAASALAEPWWQIVISDAVGLEKSPELTEIENEMEKEGLSTCIWNQDCSYYSSTNEASAHDTWRSGGQFIHIELNTSLRLESAPEETNKVIDALTEFREWFPPTITLNYPENNAVLNETEQINFNCTFYDAKNVTNVTFYFGNETNFNINESTSVNINETTQVYSRNLTNGTYLWGCFAQDINNNTKYSDNYTLTIGELPITNNIPNTELVILNSSALTNKSAEDLNCYANITDLDGDNVYANYTWYKNGVENLSGQSSSFTAGTIGFVANLASENTSAGETWTCSVKGYDGTNYENDWNNASLMINLDTEAINQSWTNITFPEGIYYLEPSTTSPGSYKFNFNITFVNLTANQNDVIGCWINQSNCYDAELVGCERIFVNQTLTNNLSNADQTISYNISTNDNINTTQGGTTSNWIPWRVDTCVIINSTGSTINETQYLKRIHVHGIEWSSGDIARAVNAKTIANQYLQNKIKTDNSGDIAYAVAKYGGTKIEDYCHDGIDNPDEPDTLIDTDDPDCWGITYSNRPDLHQDFANESLYYAPSGDHGTLANEIPAGDIYNVNTSSTTFNTEIYYTMHTMPNGTFKIRFKNWGLSKVATIIATGFPTLNNVTKIAPGNTSTLGMMEYFLNAEGDGLNTNYLNATQTYTNKFVIQSFSDQEEIENLDTTVSLTFSNASEINMSEGYIITLNLNYVEGSEIYEEEKNITIYFDDPTYVPIEDSRPRWNSTNELENDIWINDASMTWNPCNDSKNADFDLLNCLGNEEFCFEQSSYDCYDENCNLNNGPIAWNEYTSTWTSGLCGYYNESEEASMCFDNYNNDWSSEDVTFGNLNSALSLIDCRDADCNQISNGSVVCEYDIELNCTDDFDNDMYNLKDCELEAGGSYDNAEYDCATDCRINTGNNTETGEQCNDNIDNDWDKYYTTIGGKTGYALNTSTGAGMDCAWGIAADEDCNLTILSNGYRCELNSELTCNDTFDNDYDNGQGEPDAGWTEALYEAYYTTNYSANADYDDYDCQNDINVPTSEAIEASWCFDNIDQDLDEYYLLLGIWTQNSSTGRDCADPDCLLITNPDNENQTCLSKEYDPEDLFFTNLSSPDFYCKNSLDDDTDGLTDCYDSDCNQQFNLCYNCPNSENITWDACADNLDNDYGDGTDCADPDCLNQQGDYDGNICVANGDENNIHFCLDGFDNDNDGDTDCADADCQGISSCGPESDFCEDDFDNDGDGLIDCEDSDCINSINCNVSSNMESAYTPPLNNSENYGGVTVTWTQRVREGNNYSINLVYDSEYDSANLYLGRLTGNGIDTNTGLNASRFIISGPNASLFETVEYTNISDKGQIVLYDQDHSGINYHGFNVTLIIPTTTTLNYDSFEYYHSISGTTSTGNTVDVIILDNLSPIIKKIKTEPDNKNITRYNESIWVGVLAEDQENSDYNDGTIYQCKYNISGPSGYSYDEQTDSDCKFNVANIIDDGRYNISIWSEDNVGNIGTANQSYFEINLRPKYVTGSFNLSERWYNASKTINISAQFNSDDANDINQCEVYYKNSLGTITEVGTIEATNSGDLLTCNGEINPPENDEMYQLWINVTDLEGDQEKADVEIFYVCNDINSSGTGINGEKWTCGLKDMDNNAIVDQCDEVNASVIIPPEEDQGEGGTSGGGSTVRNQSREQHQCNIKSDCPEEEYCVNHQCMRIFDLKTIYVDHLIQPGESLDFNYFVKGMANISGDVTLDYWLEDKAGVKISSGSDVIFVGNFEEKIESGNLYLLLNMEEGQYKFTLRLTFEDYIIYSHKDIQVLNEAPFKLEIDPINLPEIIDYTPWTLLSSLGINKDETIVAHFERMIKQGEQVYWYKQGDVIINRTAFVTDEITDLKEGEYELVLTLKYKNYLETKSLKIKIGKSQQPIFGASIKYFGEVKNQLQNKEIILFTLLIVLTLVIFVEIKLRKWKKKKNKSKDLENYVESMIKAKLEDAKIIEMIYENSKLNVKEIIKLLNRSKIILKIEQKHKLQKEDKNGLKEFIKEEIKNKVKKEEIIKELIDQGWDGRLIKEYLKNI